jgi:acetyl/propionyl-CoA carboxylase alpha subunit
MRVVYKEEELENAIDSAKTEGKNSFGDETVLIEKYFDNVRHIEVQIFGDDYGNVISLFERECTIQRRHQKIIEVNIINNVGKSISNNDKRIKRKDVKSSG